MNEKLTPFESGLYDMVQSIEFKSVRNNFQSTQREDLFKSRLLEICSCLLIKQQTCMKCYPINTKCYWTITLRRCITRPIPKPNETSTNKPKKLFKELNLEDKMECYAKSPAYITLKDLKENFKNNKKYCLINPSKSEMGLV